MARLILAWILVFGAQQEPDRQLQEAGVCARCHVISVVEWGISRHWKAGANCIACHGASPGHVADERNNVKPERTPRGAAIAGLCAGCHEKGCRKSGKTDDCQSCHHVHALVNPKAQVKMRDDGEDDLAGRWQRFDALMSEGERLAGASQWRAARAAFEGALKQKPGDARAGARLRMCDRRLQPGLPGFEIAGSAFDGETGLPVEVRVAGLGIAMVLVPGGEFEMGSEKFSAAKPVHTVRVEPFFLGRFELTQGQWKALMGGNPSAHQGAKYPEADDLPVERISWEDASQFVARLNQRVAGGGFRLPAESEWELAARATGGEDAIFEAAAPRAAGGGKPNRLGIFDLRGNVWEWCSSLFRPYPYDAKDGREDPAAAGLRVLRGGGYSDLIEWTDAGARHPGRPNRRMPWYGMRMARDVAKCGTTP